jgi:Rad3-related DNA helicase
MNKLIPIPPELDLPKKFTHWRENQAECSDEMVASQKPYFLDAPTGSGKSLPAIAASRRLTLMDKVIDRMTGQPQLYRTIYVTRTIQLQNQVKDDFPEAVLISGRENYPCKLREKDFPGFTAADCILGCTRGDDCYYRRAKLNAMKAPLAVLNYAYYLTEINGARAFSAANVVILDEVDSLESALMEQIRFSVSKHQCEKYKIREPDLKFTIPEWIGWAEQCVLILKGIIDKDTALLPLNIKNWTMADIKLAKSIKQAENFTHSLAVFINKLDDSWILDLTENKKDHSWVMNFKPTFVANYAEDYLWRHGKRFIGMSGTILEPNIIIGGDLGLTDFNYKRLDSNFPVENRLMHYRPAANLRFNSMNEELPKLLPEIVKILDTHCKDNVLIHSTSYSIRDYLMQNLKTNSHLIMTHDKDNREEKLEQFRNSHQTVMISPSFDRGVDLADDQCRCVIVVKVPYLNSKDKQVAARLKLPSGQRWYVVKALQNIMQMTGRAVRSKNDWAACYILDKQFDRLLTITKPMIPQWWLNAINRESVNESSDY